MNLDVTYVDMFDGHSVSASFLNLETDTIVFDEELRAISGLLIKPIKRIVTLEGIRARRNDLDILKNHIETMISRLDTIQSEYVSLLEQLLEKK